MKTDLFQSCGHWWVFHNCWHNEYSTFTASSFRIWNSSAGILSLPLAFFIVIMLPKAHLTSHFSMSGSSWVTTPSWLSRPLRHFFGKFCVFLPPLLNLFWNKYGINKFQPLTHSIPQNLIKMDCNPNHKAKQLYNFQKEQEKNIYNLGISKHCLPT